MKNKKIQDYYYAVWQAAKTVTFIVSALVVAILMVLIALSVGAILGTWLLTSDIGGVILFGAALSLGSYFLFKYGAPNASKEKQSK